MFQRTRPFESTRRRGAVVAMVVVSLVLLVGMATMTIDVGMLYRARAEAQASADAAAMAGAMRLIDPDRLKGTPNMSEEIVLARSTAAEYAALNEVVNDGPQVDQTSDILVGRLNNPWDPSESLSFNDPNNYNTVRVLVRRDDVRNGPIDLFFAGIFGRNTADITAEAFATLHQGVSGFRPTNDDNSQVLPLALHVDAWNDLLDGTFTSGDNWSYDEESKTLGGGQDEINELNLYPGGGTGQLPPGNFGTIDIGGSGNSTADLGRQILHGISPEDIAALGTDFVLGPDGTIDLNGDTGLSAAIKNELSAVVGQPKVIPLFSEVNGPGNNATFTIVGFAGVRILDVKLTGSMNSKRVIIQPASVIDSTAVPPAPGTSPGPGGFAYGPVELIR